MFVTLLANTYSRGIQGINVTLSHITYIKTRFFPRIPHEYVLAKSVTNIWLITVVLKVEPYLIITSFDIRLLLKVRKDE
jgi:hypothetical protein